MDWNEFYKRFTIKLNNQQEDAVKSTEGPILLLAVPGSGKTTVLVARLGYMVYCCGIKPENILTVTYTVAATNDMRERFSKFFGNDMAERLEFRTINGICHKIISYYGNKIGRTPFELVNDERYINDIILRIFDHVERKSANDGDLKKARTLITYIKNMMLNDEEILSLDDEADMKISKIYKKYVDYMKQNRLMDYDDQMVYAYNMLCKFPEVLSHFQNVYRYICVDEAQDTSKIQHEIISLLADKDKNIFMVGDEDQSIYGFRAAYPKALLDFEKKYKNAKILLMEENFRSDGNIVKIADKFIQKNTLRHKKTMKANRDGIFEPKVIPVKNEMAQYEELIRRRINSSEEIAILYRNNESAIPLVDLLERRNLSYRMKNTDLAFFTDKVVVDIENIIKFALNPKDTELFMQIYYKIGTYIKKELAMQACLLSKATGLPVIEAVWVECEDDRIKERLRDIKFNLVKIASESARTAIGRIETYLKYGDYLKSRKISDRKLSILKILATRENTAYDLLERLAFLKNLIKNQKADYNCNFILSTIHGSKGLEYDNVYLIDIFDGNFPEKIPENQFAVGKQEREDYEEERRMFYVGMTRAKENLYMFNSNRNSTFLNEIQGKEQTRTNTGGIIIRTVPQKNDIIGVVKNDTKVIARNGRKSLNSIGISDINEFKSRLQKSTRIYHRKFGAGKFIGFDGKTVEIRFESGMKKLDIGLIYENGAIIDIQ